MSLYDKIKFTGKTALNGTNPSQGLLVYFEAPEDELNDIYECWPEHSAHKLYFLKEITLRRGFIIAYPSKDLLFAYKYKELLNNLYEDTDPKLLPVVIP